MTPAPPAALSLYATACSGTEPVQMLTRRLAAAGLGVHATHWRDRHELILLTVTAARSCLTVSGSGRAQWHYEPATGPGTDPATVTAIIVHLLGAPHTADTTTRVTAYQAFPLKGAVGRYLQDRGLTVTLRISEDLESFEATTAIEVTSPARPWLGTVQLTDDGHLDWECDYRAAFHGDIAALADVIAAILHASPQGSPRPAVAAGDRDGATPLRGDPPAPGGGRAQVAAGPGRTRPGWFTLRP